MASGGGEDRLKSAVELAMERLREKDREQGADAPRTLTDEQKAAIAEIRRRYEAKIAETEILQADSRRKAVAAGDPEQLAKLDEEHRREVETLQARRDEEIEAVRTA